MCQAKQAFIKNMVLEGYPEGPFADSIEQQVQANLPVIPELTTGLSEREEIAFMSAVIDRQRAAFIEAWGDELWSDPCSGIDGEKPVQSPTVQVRYVAMQE